MTLDHERNRVALLSKLYRDGVAIQTICGHKRFNIRCVVRHYIPDLVNDLLLYRCIVGVRGGEERPNYDT